MIYVVDLYGIYLPSLMLLAILAFVLLRVLTRGLMALGFYRLVWHRPLFDLALYIVLLALSELLFRWVTT